MADETGRAQDEPQGAPPQEPEQKEEESKSRLDGAKAFFRALYAGDEELPDLTLTGESGAAADEQSGAVQSGPCRHCQYLESQLGESEQRASEAEGLYKRMAADFENYRRRVEREREEFTYMGIQKAVESLLPALDDMDRARASLNAEIPAEKILESLDLVFNRITRCLEQIGVKPMTVVGEPFDPKFHEPVQEVQTTEVPDGAVIHELRRGYTLNDKVVRPALVNVASHSGAEQAETAAYGAISGASLEEGADSPEPRVYGLSEFDEVDEEGAAGEAPEGAEAGE